MQGIVLNIDLKSDTGLVRAADGKRYGFKLSDCETGSPLNGNTVDFEIDDDNRAVKMHERQSHSMDNHTASNAH